MNVLVINGSPKEEHSNTMQLTGAFLEGARWTDAEVIHVSSADIKPCRGCFTCWNQTPGACVIKDDMEEILAKRISADVIIWSFPLYYFSVPGGLKNLIDRQLPLNLPDMDKTSQSGDHLSRYDLSHQQHVVISTCGFWTPKGNYDSVRAIFDHICGKENYTSIFCGQGELFRVPELKNRTDAYLEFVQEAGREFAAGGIQAETLFKLSEPLYPRQAFETMADASWSIPDAGTSNKDFTDDSLNFTKQMAALYQPDGIARVVEFYYTDIDKTYQLHLNQQGAEVHTKHLKPYTTRIETPYALWRAISRGEINGQDALFQQLYSVSGDFDLMLNFDTLFGMNAPEPEHAHAKKTERTSNLNVFLFPWILIWITMVINPTIGSILGILSAAALPLLWLVFEPVVYEQLSVPMIAGLSLAVLFGADIQIIVPLSYLLFGLLWMISAFSKTPLSAYYSAAHYGGSKAFANRLFMRTNRILTAAWGALYLITPIWTYVLMGTSLSPLTGLINSICPAFLGIFTKWFQKWYPAQWASKKTPPSKNNGETKAL